MLQVFIQSLLIGYSGAVMPGSLLTFTIDRSLKYGGAGPAMLVPLGHVGVEALLVVAIFFRFRPIPQLRGGPNRHRPTGRFAVDLSGRQHD